ncbi:MAG: tRNA pseudouridine(55) synthase TruB [Phycisphaerales bacterium]|nr:tRNA pseudouridine(55) synthase TruB [Phycisphaerales bacterium]
MRKRDPNLAPLDGVLIIDKPLSMSSSRVVEIVRRHAQHARTGHAGTLDPLASGVLVLALGRATKAIDLLMATEKRYETDIDLSAFTTTDDREGEREEVVIATPPTNAQLIETLERFVGTQLQTPPAYSAVHINGRRAYALARSGQAVTPPPREVSLLSASLLAYEFPIARVALRTGKGFYVRSLARDFGKALGTGGHCATLRRTAVGPFTLEHAHTLDQLPNPLDASNLIPLESALQLCGKLL